MKKVHTVDSLSATITKLFDSVHATSTELQAHMVDLFRLLEPMSKKDVLSNPAVSAVFAHGMKGMDRRRLVAWTEAFTPVRIKFMANGRFEKLSWSASFVRDARAADEPTFKWEAAAKVDWVDFEPAASTVVAKGNIAKAIETLALHVAREAVETQSLTGAMDKVDLSNLQDLVLKIMAEDKFHEWAAARTVELEAAERVAQQHKAERVASIDAMIERNKAAA